MKEFCVYILKCSDGSFYTGMTSNIESRLLAHNVGKYPNCYTFDKRPLKLVFLQNFQSFDQAMMWEKKIKRMEQKEKISINRRTLGRLTEIQ